MERNGCVDDSVRGDRTGRGEVEEGLGTGGEGIGAGEAGGQVEKEQGADRGVVGRTGHAGQDGTNIS